MSIGGSLSHDFALSVEQSASRLQRGRDRDFFEGAIGQGISPISERILLGVRILHCRLLLPQKRIFPGTKDDDGIRLVTTHAFLIFAPRISRRSVCCLSFSRLS